VYYRKSLVLTLYFDSAHLGRGLIIKRFVWSYAAVEYLVALENRSIGFLDGSHDLLSIPHFPVESFHLVVVPVSLNPDMANMHGPKLFMLPVLLKESVIKGG
jgi:hypothetical protein